MATDEIIFTDPNGTVYDLTVTVVSTDGTDDGTGTITAITGTVGTDAVTGLDTTGLGADAGADNTITSTSFPQIDENGLSFDTASDAYVVYGDGNGDIDIYDLQGNVAGIVTDYSFDVLCYLRGTMIMTPTGEVAVEQLRAGDPVSLAGGGSAPVRWIGQARVLVQPGTQSPARPVLIRSGALAKGVPSRDLYVTKGHALYLAGHLIPAEFLVNHRSIVWDDRAREVEYFHIELPTHQVILANGAPAESYRDEANRWMFHNATPDMVQRDVAPFAPVVTGGPIVDAVWTDLLRRAGMGSPVATTPVATTKDADLHLLIDGNRIDAKLTSPGRAVFEIPADAREIVIASRAARQDELGRCRDPRLLGIAIGQILLWRDGAFTLIGADHAALTEGFHTYEPDGGHIWTNGQALLPETITGGPGQARELHLAIRHTTHYRLEQEDVRQAA